MVTLFDFGQNTKFYTRADALKEGVLIDLTTPCFKDVADRFAFGFPIAITIAAFEKAVGDSKEPNLWAPETLKQLTRVLTCLFSVAQARDLRGNKRQPQFTLIFSVPGDFRSENTQIVLKLMLSPGNNGDPVLTIILPEEEYSALFNFHPEFR